MLSESLVGKEKFLIPTENKNDENEQREANLSLSCIKENVSFLVRRETFSLQTVDKAPSCEGAFLVS